MFDTEHGVEVRVQLWATKQTLGESKPSPQSALYIDDRRHRMIEAKTDQRFQIEFVITKNFDFKGCKYLRALVEVDGGIRSLSKHVFNNCIRSHGIKKGQSSYHMSTLRTSNSGSWKNLGFAFAQLKPDQNINMTAEEAVKEALARGNITVTIQRGSAIRSDFDPDDEPVLASMRSLKTSEKVINEHCKTHSFK